MNNKTKADNVVEMVKKAWGAPNSSKIIEGLQKPMWTVPTTCPNCERYRKALENILTYSTDPFVKRNNSDNMKWLNYVHEVANGALK